LNTLGKILEKEETKAPDGTSQKTSPRGRYEP